MLPDIDGVIIISMMNRKIPGKKTAFAAVIAIASIVLIVLLSVWTHELQKQDIEMKVKDALRSIVQQEGDRALFEAAGIPVDEIHYSYEDLPLFAGRDGTWEYSDDDRRTISLFRKAAPSVVQIMPSSDLSGNGDGAGVILSSDGYIVTNSHVAPSASIKYTVKFFDGSISEAVLVGTDPLSDIALLKTDKGNLQAIGLASSGAVMTGESVYAIGHPYGYAWTLSAGIVSGTDRIVSSSASAVIPSMIQTDAAINPGNSGGPLLKQDGTMIGIVSSIHTQTGSSDGVAFAIPAERVIDSVREIIDTGAVHRGWLDLLSVELNESIAQYAGLTVSEGILVSQVVPGGNADKAGIRGGNQAVQYGQSVIYLGGDVITAINGIPINGYEDYFAALFDTNPGDTVELSLIRNGSPITIDAVLIERTVENSGWIAR